jgi:hypothetical protein
VSAWPAASLETSRRSGIGSDSQTLTVGRAWRRAGAKPRSRVRDCNGGQDEVDELERARIGRGRGRDSGGGAVDVDGGGGAGVIAYASRTGTRRNLDALRAAGWRLLVSARGVLRDEGFPYGLDNGAWTAFQRGEPFDVAAFERALEWGADNADWVILPDIVAGGIESLRFSLGWAARLQGVAPLLLAVQDGMSVDDVRNVVGPDIGIAVGGSTEWKELTCRAWGALAAEQNAYMHVLRVNTARRIHICAAAGANSFDGSSVSRFAKTLPRLDAARRQQSIFGGIHA